MTYSEEADFQEKANVLQEFHNRLAHHKIPKPSLTARVLEIGGSGGVLGALLSASIGRIFVSDINDTNVQYGGEFGRLLKEKFERNHRTLELGKIEFHVADAMELPYRDAWFDLLISQNAFEHIPDPVKALREAIRVTRKGGVIYLTFDPIWTADTGNHFSHYVAEPWRHLLESDEDFCEKMRVCGASDAEVNDYLLGMNRKPLNTYTQQFQSVLKESNVSWFHYESWSGCVHPSHVAHPNRRIAASRLDCDPDELLVRGLCYLIVK